jgi:hypothetical protein
VVVQISLQKQAGQLHCISLTCDQQNGVPAPKICTLQGNTTSCDTYGWCYSWLAPGSCGAFDTPADMLATRAEAT